MLPARPSYRALRPYRGEPCSGVPAVVLSRPQYRVHPTARVHPDAVVSPDSVIGPCAVVEAGVVLEDECRIMPRAQVGAKSTLTSACIGYGATVGRGSLIVFSNIGGAAGSLRPARVGPGAQVYNSSVGAGVVAGDRLYLVSARLDRGVRLGEGVRLESGALVAGGSRIGDRVYVGPGSVVRERVSVGADTRLVASVRVESRAQLAERVEVSSAVARLLVPVPSSSTVCAFRRGSGSILVCASLVSIRRASFLRACTALLRSVLDLPKNTPRSASSGGRENGAHDFGLFVT